VSIPSPEPGLVICYRYLWLDELKEGREEGKKDRPAVIILCARQDDDGSVVVTVLPITHRAPQGVGIAVEIPGSVKRHLGLDAEPSWVVVNEVNEFVWPGFDLQRIGRTGRYDYGFLPPRFLEKLKHAADEWRRAGRIGLVARDQ